MNLKIRYIVSALFVICSIGIGTVSFALNNASKSDSYIENGIFKDVTSAYWNKEINFCEFMKAKTDIIKAQSKPNSTIMLSDYKSSLMKWKELFLEHNAISDDHFDDRLRISSIHINSYAKNSFFVLSYYVADWAHVFMDGGFKTNTLGKSIRKVFDANSVYTTNDLEYMSSIQIDGSISQQIMGCEEATEILVSKNEFLVPKSIRMQDGVMVLFAEGKTWDIDAPCAYAELNLTNGDIIDYRVGRCLVGPCPGSL